jgi:hypothetical protein
MESFSITKAKARVLTKASSGCVMISGGFSGTEDKECIHLPQFDRRQHIEPLVAVGLLVPGEYANQYCLSEQGGVALADLPKSMRWQPDA